MQLIRAKFQFSDKIPPWRPARYHNSVTLQPPTRTRHTQVTLEPTLGARQQSPRHIHVTLQLHGPATHPALTRPCHIQATLERTLGARPQLVAPSHSRHAVLRAAVTG